MALGFRTLGVRALGVGALGRRVLGFGGFDTHNRTKQARLDESPAWVFRRSHSDNPGEAFRV